MIRSPAARPGESGHGAVRRTRLQWDRIGVSQPVGRMKGEEPSFLDTLKSVLAAFFGVQSNERRERDFTHGKPVYFIVIGLVLTVLFILVVLGIVRGVMYLSGVQ